MKFFRSDVQSMTFDLVELDRSHWRVMPPKRLAVIATIAIIIVSAVLWGLL